MKTIVYLFSLSLVVLSLTSCTTDSSLDDTFAGRKVDYKQQSRVIQRLDVPPEMISERMNDFMVISNLASENENGKKSLDGQVATVNGYKQLLVKTDNVRFVNEDNVRYLVIKDKKEVIWEKIRNFWLSSGIEIKSETPAIGIMETKWLENRADIPDDFISSILKQVVANVYSSGTRDKYRVRFEENYPADNSIRLYVTHYGLEEVDISSNESVEWRDRPREPELEAEILGKMMVYLGLEAEQAKQLLAKQAKIKSEKAKIVADNNGVDTLVLQETFARAWRQTAIALDRIDFAIEDRNRESGIFYILYAGQKEQDKSWFDSLAFWGSDESAKQKSYQIKLSKSAEKTHITVSGKDNAAVDQSIVKKIIGLLFEQLK